MRDGGLSQEPPAKEIYMLDSAFETALAAGTIVGAVLVATILVVPFVRYAALIATTSVIVVIYLRGGVAELITFVNAVQSEMADKPIFSAGMIAGTALVVVAFGGRPRRAAK
jgi:hypothetical protein